MEPDPVIRVLVVDDHEVVRRGLHAFLDGEPDLEVVADAGGGEEALELFAQLDSDGRRPDVVLMDLRLPDGSGLEACREILSAAPQIRILFLTSHSDEQAVMSTVLAGAAGYVLKDIGHQALVKAIHDAAAGRPTLDPRVAAPVAHRMQHADALSKQEQRVLALVVEGKTNKEIALALGLSDKTVKNYLSNAFQKLGVARRSQAAALFAHGRVGRE